jgi:hypothetical protein
MQPPFPHREPDLETLLRSPRSPRLRLQGLLYLLTCLTTFAAGAAGWQPLVMGLDDIAPLGDADARALGDPACVVLLHPSGLAPQRERALVVAVVDAVDRAVAGGAQLLWGGGRHAFGAQYLQPTMLAGVNQSDEIVQDEVFGPVLTLQTFASDNEAVELANGTDYGLGGVCYGEQAHATEIADQVRTGFIWVNCFGIRDLAAPFGGIKRSGIGREGGNWSFDFFCDVKDVVLPKKPFRPSFSHR